MFRDAKEKRGGKAENRVTDSRERRLDDRYVF
jgi:hypothetical protein